MSTISIFTSQPYEQDTSDIITICQYRKKRISRRKRVSRRLAKRFPLFALEFMREEFPEMDYETWEQDVITKKKSRSKRKGRSQLKRQGRYPMYEKAMMNYRLSKDVKHLEQAQKIRNRMFKDFLFDFRLRREIKIFRLPSTASLRLVKKIMSIKDYDSWEEHDKLWNEAIKYEKF